MLKPLGHRILVKPDGQDEQTASGLVLPGDRDYVPTSGTVVAVGDGPERDARIRSKTISRCVGVVAELTEGASVSVEVDKLVYDILAELGRYKNQVERFEAGLRVGDRVVYAAESGLKLTEDGQDYILLNEDDAVAVATEEVAA